MARREPPHQAQRMAHRLRWIFIELKSQPFTPYIYCVYIYTMCEKDNAYLCVEGPQKAALNREIMLEGAITEDGFMGAKTKLRLRHLKPNHKWYMKPFGSYSHRVRKNNVNHVPNSKGSTRVVLAVLPHQVLRQTFNEFGHTQIIGPKSTHCFHLTSPLCGRFSVFLIFFSVSPNFSRYKNRPRGAQTRFACPSQFWPHQTSSRGGSGHSHSPERDPKPQHDIGHIVRTLTSRALFPL